MIKMSRNEIKLLVFVNAFQTKIFENQLTDKNRQT